MSIHQPPSSYILRELSEVSVPEHVSWFPQTIGWYVLGAIASAIVFYYGIQLGKKWWHNRYRREAFALVAAMQNTLQTTDAISGNDIQQMTYDLFEIMKAVLVYIDPERTSVFNTDFLMALDQHHNKAIIPFNGGLGQSWMLALLQKKQVLSSQELSELLVMCGEWLTVHSASVTILPNVKKGSPNAA